MKARIFLGIAFISCFYYINANAQLGISIGMGASDIAFNDEGQVPYLGQEINSLTHSLPKLSIQAGGFYRHSLSDRIDLQPELLMSLQGLNYSERFLYDHIKHRIDIFYLKVPVLLKYKVFSKEKVQSGLEVGPYAALKIGASLTTEVEGVREHLAVVNIRNNDLGLTVGYFWDINLDKNSLTLDIRTSYSLSNMMDVIDDYVTWYYGPEDEYARNILISFNVGYHFIKTADE